MKKILSLWLCALVLALSVCGFSACKGGGASGEGAVVLAQSVTLDYSSINLVVGQSETLKATVFPENTTDKSLLWQSGNEKIVTVENGVVTAHAVGTAAISVETVNGMSAICSVKVVKDQNEALLGTPVESSILTFSLNKDGKGYTVTGIGACKEPNVLISSYLGLPVTAIAEGALAGCESLVSVRLGESVATVGDRAFFGCPNLILVEMEGVQTVGSAAFSSCISLKEVVLSSDITVIEDGTFSGCAALQKINLHDALTAIGSYAFSGCSSLTKVVLGRNMHTVGEYAFAACNKLSVVECKGDSITIGANAFRDCMDLSHAVFGEGLREIGSGAFLHCTKLFYTDFRNKEGWKRYSAQGDDEGVALTEEELSDMDQISNWLSEEYAAYTWKCEKVEN